MKSNQYWINRVSKITWQRYNDLEQENKKLLKFYQQAIDQVERELAKIAIKMQSNPSLSNQHNQKRLSELKSKMSKITEELMLKIKGFTEEQIHKAIINQYQDVIVKIVGNDFALPNEELIKMMMDNPWSGANFSDRLWRNKSLLEFNLNEVLTRGFIQGKTTVEIAKELSLRVEKNFDVCLRLVRTERMHYLNESSKKPIKMQELINFNIGQRRMSVLVKRAEIIIRRLWNLMRRQFFPCILIVDALMYRL